MMTNTIQCPRCKHTFVPYAAGCPQCGLEGPSHIRANWGSWVAVLTSGVALTAAVLMAMKVKEHDEAPSFRGQASAMQR